MFVEGSLLVVTELASNAVRHAQILRGAIVPADIIQVVWALDSC
jgi:two-component sensor histidine kinase